MEDSYLRNGGGTKLVPLSLSPFLSVSLLILLWLSPSDWVVGIEYVFEAVGSTAEGAECGPRFGRTWGEAKNQHFYSWSPSIMQTYRKNFAFNVHSFFVESRCGAEALLGCTFLAFSC